MAAAMSRCCSCRAASASAAAAERRDSGAESLPGQIPANRSSAQSEFTLQLVSAAARRSVVNLASFAAAIKLSKVAGSSEPPPQPAMRAANAQKSKVLARRVAFALQDAGRSVSITFDMSGTQRRHHS